ncbi:MAG: DUF2283 domain-containing protein [Candidatus Omnitrophica bacterium]|nr:DUF2283 domain-containing protein [Candidatus Omnitrophota bacterium]
MATIRYWKDVDVLDITLTRGTYQVSEPVGDDVILDISQSGELLAIEIHHASKRLAKSLAQRMAHRYAVVQ